MTGLTLCVLLIFGSIAATLAPDSDLGKAFQRRFVEAPARLLNRGPAKIFVAIIVLVALMAIAVAAPEMVALVGLGDLSIYLDLVVLSLILGAAKVFNTAGSSVVAAVRRYVDRSPLRLGRPSLRARRIRKPRRPTPSEDAAPSGAWATA